MANTEQMLSIIDAQSQPENSFPIKARRFVTIQDMTPGSYQSNQVVFSTEQLNNSTSWVSFQHSYLTIPYTIDLNANGAVDFTADSTALNDTATLPAIFKRSFIDLVHSLSVTINGNEVVGTQPFHNIHQYWKFFAELSKDNEELDGATLGFNSHLNGSSNLVNAGAQNSYYETVFKSGGRYANVTEIDVGLSDALCNQLAQPYITRKAGNKGAIINGLAQIQLCHLHPMFASLPLCRSTNMKITLNMNSGSSATWTAAAAEVENLLLLTPVINCPTQNFPLLLNQTPSRAPVAAVPNGAPAVAGVSFLKLSAAGSATLSCTLGNVFMRACELHMCIVEPSVDVERSILSDPVRTVRYNDSFTNTTIRDVAPGAQVNQQTLFNSQAAARGMWIIPMPSRAANRQIYATNSPVSTEVARRGILTNVMVHVSGNNLYPTPITYTHAHFLQHARMLQGRNTGANQFNMLGVRSGLLSQMDWFKHPVFYLSLTERGPAEEDAISKHYAFSCVNSSNTPLDLLIFFEYSKEFMLETSTSALV